MKALKEKKCRTCKDKFTPWNSLQVTCSPLCGIKYAREMSEKKQRKLHREKKQAIKTKSELLKEAQSEFNKFIRIRDSQNPCISCGRHHTGQYHAGHYRTVGAAPELRYNEDNVHKQCSACNNHKSGNVLEYRSNLINKIGLKRVYELEGIHPPLKLTREEIIAIKKEYRAKWKELDIN